MVLRIWSSFAWSSLLVSVVYCIYDLRCSIQFNMASGPARFCRAVDWTSPRVHSEPSRTAGHVDGNALFWLGWLCSCHSYVSIFTLSAKVFQNENASAPQSLFGIMKLFFVTIQFRARSARQLTENGGWFWYWTMHIGLWLHHPFARAFWTWTTSAFHGCEQETGPEMLMKSYLLRLSHTLSYSRLYAVAYTNAPNSL